MPADPYTASEANDAWRASLGQPFTRADRLAIAAFFGVSVRTVERWMTQAGQRRNPIPGELSDVDFEDWPERYQRRGRFAQIVAEGWESDVISEKPEEQYIERFATVTDAYQWAIAAIDGTLDPWVTASLRALYITKSGTAWHVVVTYERIDSPDDEPPGGI